MSQKERERLKVLSRVKRGELKLVEAAALVFVSVRRGGSISVIGNSEIADCFIADVAALPIVVTKQRSSNKCWPGIRSGTLTLGRP